MRRRLAAALLALATILSAAVTTASGARAAPTADEPALELVDLDPWVGRDTTVTARVAGHHLGSGSTVTATLYDAIATRSAFMLTMDGQNLLSPLHQFEPTEVDGDDTIDVRFDVTDGTAPATDTDPADATPSDRSDDTDQLVLRRPGVYPLVFTARGTDDEEVTRLVTYLVRLPDQAANGDDGRHPLAVATQLRLLPRPTIGDEGDLTVDSRARRTARDLIDGIGAVAADDVEATVGFTISPALLDAAERTGDHELVGRLAEITAPGALQLQPWSPVALGRWLNTPELEGEARRLTAKGTATLERYLHAPDPAAVDLTDWGDGVSTTMLQWFLQRDATGFVVPDDALVPLDTTQFPRSLAAPFLLETDDPTMPTVPAVRLDRTLSDHFTETDTALGANHLIADLSVMALDLPSIRRGVVVAPPPDQPPAAALVTRYLDALGAEPPPGSARLLAPTTLTTLLSEVPAARAAGDTATEGPELVRQLADTELAGLPALGREVERTTGLVDSLATMEPSGTTATVPVLRERIALAAMPGQSARERTRLFTGVTDTVRRTAGAVHLSERQTITLTSADASLPITIRRDAAGPTRVTLHIDAPDRITFPDGTTRTVDLDDDVTRIDLRVHADSPGDTLIRLIVTSPDGGLVAGTTDLMVRSTTASGVGLIISFGSLAFLIGWWIRDIVRARRRRRARHIAPADLIDIEP